MKIIFTLVIFNNQYDEIKDLINSIIDLNNDPRICFEIILSVHDNSRYYPNSNINQLLKQQIDNSFTFIYTHKNKNIGYGRGNNSAFIAAKKNKTLNKNDLVIVVNPDISFKKDEIISILNFLSKETSDDVVCLSPTMYNTRNDLQFSAKENPTLLSLLIGRIKFLENFNLFKEYISKKQNRVATSKFIFESQYLSGCFLVIKGNIFDQINGFDERYFLHFEDADITRELSKIGKCIHFPYAKIQHRWNRGSHKSPKQTILLINSMIKYFTKWGLNIF